MIVRSILIVLLFCSQAIKAQLLDSLALDSLKPYTTIQSALRAPDKVIKLVLRKNKLKAFPSEISRFKNLQYLDLSKNNIKEIPAWIDTLQSLQVLILSKNNIDVLPVQVCRLINLKILNISQNEIELLPDQIGDLENLEVLDMWDNNLGNFPEQMTKLKKLKMVDLRAILIDEEVQQHLQNLIPFAKIYFSPSCKCKTQ